MKKLMFLIFVLGTIDVVYAQKSIQTQQQSWSEFKDNEGDNWKARWSEGTGVPKIIYNGVSKSYMGTPVTIARQFLLDNRNLFSMKESLSDLKHKYTKTNRGIQHVTFYQDYQNVIINEAEYKVHISPNGQVIMANGNYYPNIEISVIPTLSKQEIVTHALNRVENTQELSSSFTEPALIIYPTNKAEFKLAYKTSNTKSNERYIIDAHSGKVERKRRR